MRPRYKKFKNKEWLEEQIKKGLSGRQIAINNNLPISTVRLWMIKFNLWNYKPHPNSVNIIKKLNSNVTWQKTKKRTNWRRNKIEAIIARRKSKNL